MTNELKLVDKGASATGLVAVEQQRAVQEVQAALVIAKRFPRDVNEAYTRIIKACQRKTLAETATYAYPKGKKVINGPSIRLAETMAQSWGNMQFGIRELSQANGASEVEAFAWDVETNTRQVKLFTVRHHRDTKSGGYALTDSRDIYEMVANQGARRLRACILGVIPGDIVDAAVKQCEQTLASDNEPIEDRVRKMLVKFGDMGVTQEMLEARLGHNLKAIAESELVGLRQIYTSMNDGMSKREDWFDLHASDRAAAEDDLAALKKPAPKVKPKPSSETVKAVAEGYQRVVKPEDNQQPGVTQGEKDALTSKKVDKDLGAGMNVDQLLELFEKKMSESGIKEQESRQACLEYVRHCMNQSKSSLHDALVYSINNWVPFLTGMGSWKKALKDAEDNEVAESQELEQDMADMRTSRKPTGSPAYNSPPEGTRYDGLPKWDSDHPLWPDAWKNMRSGNGKTTGLAVYVDEHARSIERMDDATRQALQLKYSRLYPGTLLPMIGAKGEYIDPASLPEETEEAEETVQEEPQQESAGNTSEEERGNMIGEVLGLRAGNVGAFSSICSKLGIKTTFPHKMSSKELSSLIDAYSDDAANSDDPERW